MDVKFVPRPVGEVVQGRSRLSEPLTFLYAAWSAKTSREARVALLEAVSVDRFTNGTTATSCLLYRKKSRKS